MRSANPLLIVVLVVAAAAAQEPTPQVLKSSASAVVVDVVVRDKKDNAGTASRLPISRTSAGCSSSTSR
jgi:hypothetical protein